MVARSHTVAALALLSLAGCSAPSTPSADSAASDGTIHFRDIGGTRDTSADTRIQLDLTSDATSDGVPRADLPAGPDLKQPRADATIDGSAGPGCVKWTAWQCTAGAFFPCNATCTDTSSRAITCNSAGQCSCVKNGQALSCAAVAPATGCSVCQAAMLGGCCAGD